jgi:hypothetical protein
MKTMQKFYFIPLVILLVVFSCNVVGERGNGNVVREERKVSSFNGIEVSGAFDVLLSQGPVQSLIVEADQNLMKIIKTEVVGNTLRISQREPIRDAKSLKIFITVPEMKRIEVSGAVDIETQTKFTQNEMSLEISGATDAKLDLAVQKLEVSSSGGCDLKLSGVATVFAIDASGAVEVKAYDLLSESVSIDISGAGNAEVNASKEIKASVSGAGDVRYKGNPAKVWSDVSGAGSMRKAD